MYTVARRHGTYVCNTTLKYILVLFNVPNLIYSIVIHQNIQI